MRREACPPVRPDLLANLEELTLLIRPRRSVRLYRKKPVAQAVLAGLFNLARVYAPTARNSQQLGWWG